MAGLARLRTSRGRFQAMASCGVFGVVFEAVVFGSFGQGQCVRDLVKEQPLVFQCPEGVSDGLCKWWSPVLKEIDYEG